NETLAHGVGSADRLRSVRAPLSGSEDLMHRSARLALLTIVFGFAPTAIAQAASPGAARAVHQRASRYLAPLIDLDVFQGAVLLARGDRILLEEGFGLANFEHGIPNSPRSVFRIASLSKVATEVALGKLIESGALSLDDPLERFLPSFPR